MTHVETVSPTPQQKGVNTDTHTQGKGSLSALKGAADNVLKCCGQLLKEVKNQQVNKHSDASQITVTLAALREALAKLVAAYIKSTGETGKVLFGESGTKHKGLVGAEMKMGFSSANAAKSAMDAQATGMIVAGCFSIAAGCMAIGGVQWAPQHLVKQHLHCLI